MKRQLIVLIMGLATLSAAAQIKISDNLNTEVRSMNKPELVSKKLVPLDEIHVYKQNCSFGLNANPIDCGVYILSDEIRDWNGYYTGIYEHPCVNFNDNTLTFKPLSPGEYKITDIIRFQEHFNRWVGHISTTMESSDLDAKRFMSWLQYYTDNSKMPTVDDYILGNYWKKGLCIYTLTNSSGEEYYLLKEGEYLPFGEYLHRDTASGHLQKVKSYDYGNYASAYYDSYRLILLPYYEKATELIGSNCAIIGDFDSTHKDFTGNMFVLKDVEIDPEFGDDYYSEYRSNRNKYTFYKCKDVSVYKEHVTAIFESAEGDTFALPLSKLDEMGIYRTRGEEDLYLYNDSSYRPISILPEKRFIEEEERYALKHQAKELEQAAKEQAKEQAEMQRREELIAKYGEINGNTIADRKVAIGMTKEMCEDAWGKLHETYITITEGSETEFWVYDYKTSLYFENGVLISIDK